MSKKLAREVWDNIPPKRIRPRRIDVLVGILIAVAGILLVFGII